MNLKIFTKREEAQLNMMDVVIEHLDNNADFVALNLGFKDAVEEVKPIIAAIKATAPQSAASTAGITAGKGTSKQTVSEKTARIAGLAYAYAEKTANPEMQAVVDVSKSELKEMKDGELALRCQEIHDLAAANQVALQDYGVTVAKLADLQTAIDGFAQTAQKPRAAITDRSVVKADLKTKFAQANKIFKKRLDRLIEDYAETHPDFVAAYKAKRIIVDPKTKSKGNGETPPA